MIGDAVIQNALGVKRTSRRAEWASPSIRLSGISNRAWVTKDWNIWVRSLRN